GERETLHVLNHPARYQLSVAQTLERIRRISAGGITLDAIEVTDTGQRRPLYESPEIPLVKIATDDAHGPIHFARAWVEVYARRDSEGRARGARGRDPRQAHDLGTTAAPLRRRPAVDRGRVRQDSSGRARRSGRAGAPDPRGPDHPSEDGAHESSRPGRGLAGRYGAAAATQRQHDAPGPRRGLASRALAGAARLDRLGSRERRRGARVRDALRAGDRQGDVPAVRPHVRQRLHAGARP